MNAYASGGRPSIDGGLARVATLTTYTVLGSILCLTRFIGLGRSYWHDEIVTVRNYVRAGPHAILAGPYIPNNHELFSLLGWAASSVLGESAILLRLWSVVPFVAGVLAATAWLHLRVSRLSGVLFLFFATVSPLLLDLSRQARGYGLAFLAMSVMTVVALEAERSGRTWAIVVFSTAGILGTMTLPDFGIAFLATGAVLLTAPRLRQRTALALAASLLALGLWYAPHLGDLAEQSRQSYGEPIGTVWVLTAPIDQILIPAFLWIDGVVLLPGVVWLPVVALAVLIIAASPLLRHRRPAAILASGVVATVAVLWITRIDVVPRFLSFLLVPLLMLVASGSAAILARLTTRPLIVRTVVVATVLVLVSVNFAMKAAQVTRLPREAQKDAAAIIRAKEPSAAVLAYTWRPSDLVFYLGTPVKPRPAGPVAAAACRSGQAVVLVVQPPLSPPASLSCFRRQGTLRYRFEQYARGDEIDVWLIPAR